MTILSSKETSNESNTDSVATSSAAAGGVNNNNNNNNNNTNDNNNPRIRRRVGGTAAANGMNNRNNSNSSSDSPPSSRQQYHRPLLARSSVADYQDGKRFSAAENTSILKDTAEAFQNISTRLLQSTPKNNNNNNNSNNRGNNNRAAKGRKVADERTMNNVRFGVGLYRNFPLANAILAGSYKRETALKQSGHKQMNHVRGTDGWWRSMLVIEDRAMDVYLGPWIVISLNALLACILTEILGVKMPKETLQHWDTVSSVICFVWSS